MDRRALRRRTTSTAGFSLIELLVVSAIFVILSSIVLANNARFGNHIVLQNLAHDIALSVRQAQVYGISVQGFQGSTFSAGYGAYFQSSSPNTYVLFADVSSPENGLYDGGETVRATTIAPGYGIMNICATTMLGGETCGLTRVDIVFKRPEPDALIRANGASTLYQRARIVVLSNSGETADIIIDATGQIYVD